ncbi:hypothetical protein SELMODRAFT_148911 [Selaginella moellendorffii]|uniref:TAFII55 protein conserved region domain-containing protein n=1 Tax=Selaginella moellendorffii TaxID=88036 RepID=D8RPV1_SELML|nr:transcription initiation factor TFIID subunit 7 [Selaginella moellendorffii]EFJ25744.1 hypothetical protein SELMODRAFT_148911 [Selaginella moellendorffii]|eukprot:XP_024533975.1 transcription initiation factor TFIID subunit 7 [Selaginella moellendorffii]
MEEQFVLRVPPSVAEKLHSILSENSDEDSIDLAFNGDGRTGKFTIGQDEYEVSLVDLPCVVESYKTYDHSVLIKTADIGQMILVNDPENPSKPDATPEYKHGLTPAMKNARKRRFRRQPDMDPEYVSKVEEDLTNIMAGGTARDVDVEVLEQEEEVEDEPVQRKPAPEPVPAGVATDKNKVSKPVADGSSSSDDGDYDDDSDN